MTTRDRHWLVLGALFGIAFVPAQKVSGNPSVLFLIGCVVAFMAITAGTYLNGRQARRARGMDA